MRSDMAKVVTERPRRGHGNPSKKWGRRLRKHEYDAEDHGPTRAAIARRHQYGWNAKEFSDLLGPLRRYLHKQVGRPWDKVWSEITRWRCSCTACRRPQARSTKGCSRLRKGLSRSSACRTA